MRANTGNSSSLFRIGLLAARLAFGFFLGFFLCAAPGLAQNRPQVQILTGSLDSGDLKLYDLPNLKKGDTLYVYLARLSGNLDPLVAVANVGPNLKSFKPRLKGILQKSQESFFKAYRDLLSAYYLAWDDDGGRGSDAALKFRIPANGDYKIMVTGTHQGLTFGEYHLLLGLNAPQVLSGRATPTGQVIARLSQPSASPVRIQEVRGDLTPQRNATYYRLRHIDAGDTLYVRVQTTAGNLKPALILKDYGGKIVRADNLSGLHDVAQLQYTFKEKSRNYTVHLHGIQEDKRPTSGSYRLLLGVDAPEVLKGKGKPVGLPVIRQPIRVRVGIYLNQITEVNQKNENFGAVGDLDMEWQAPDFAFSPDSCQCDSKTFTRAEFEKFVLQHDLRWPRFIFANQQGKRWSQGEVFWVYPSGKVQYYERFSATFQAPDFNFRKFPFDSQKFFINLECTDYQEDFVFDVFPQYTWVGKQLGEEEWYIVKHSAKVTGIVWPDGSTYSRYSFQLLARRHLSYYIFRIFIPLILIVTVSWVAFFLKDYSKRVDISGANLLVFIAFNFTIGSDLPHLGYLTFLDTMLIVAFAVTALTVVANVALRRLEAKGRIALAEKIDTYLLWGYPLFYIGGMFVLIPIFFL